MKILMMITMAVCLLSMFPVAWQGLAYVHAGQYLHLGIVGTASTCLPTDSIETKIVTQTAFASVVWTAILQCFWRPK